MINQALLANRRAIAKLFVNLMEADLKGDIFYHRKLEERIKTWRAKWKQKIIYSFRSEISFIYLFRVFVLCSSCKSGSQACIQLVKTRQSLSSGFTTHKEKGKGWEEVGNQAQEPVLKQLFL